MEKRTELGDLTEQMLRIEEMLEQVPRLVLACRYRGVSWELIGRALGMTKQGAQQKYGHFCAQKGA